MAVIHASGTASCWMSADSFRAIGALGRHHHAGVDRPAEVDSMTATSRRASTENPTWTNRVSALALPDGRGARAGGDGDAEWPRCRLVGASEPPSFGRSWTGR